MNYPFYQQMPQSTFTPGRPTYMDVMQQQNQQYLAIKGRPVASFDEAKASMIDFDGSIFYFPDAANQKIYTKQINLDGTSSLKVYALVQTPTSQQNTFSELPDNIVTKKEFESAINNLTNEIQNLKGVMNKNDESPVVHESTSAVVSNKSSAAHDIASLKF